LCGSYYGIARNQDTLAVGRINSAVRPSTDGEAVYN
jgi:hypothetical protein